MRNASKVIPNRYSSSLSAGKKDTNTQQPPAPKQKKLVSKQSVSRLLSLIIADAFRAQLSFPFRAALGSLPGACLLKDTTKGKFRGARLEPAPSDRV